jgi:putative transposase
MNDVESLSHTKWECKYHIVYLPKHRKKALYGALRQQLGEVFKQLAMRRESRIEEGHLRRDHPCPGGQSRLGVWIEPTRRGSGEPSPP